MMASIPIYATPFSSQQKSLSSTGSGLKRKRDALKNGQDAESTAIKQEALAPQSRSSVDYTAVVTPIERIQRRLAGLPLDQAPPPLPFPHFAIPSSKVRSEAHRRRAAATNKAGLSAKSATSLHRQHVSAIMAVLHRSMAKFDYDRALRAMGLILRTRSGGHAADIRSEGLWGVGAEILLRSHGSGPSPLDSSSMFREGFKRTQAYFETLSVQFPQHKTWPDVVNTVDFCAALFNLWIFVVQQEKMQIEMEEDNEGYGSTSYSQQALMWELAHARRIAQSLGARMQDVLLREQPILMQLRRMVALWTADLCATAAAQETDTSSSPSNDYLYDNQNTEVAAISSDKSRIDIEASKTSAQVQLLQEEAECRRLAMDMSVKLQYRASDDDRDSLSD